MNKPDIEAIYSLSPMQQGLLFHSLYSPGSGMYFEQMSCRIEGRLEVEAFQRSWQTLVDRHSILRTSFLWEGVKEPVQIVHRNVKVSWKQGDWRGLSPSEQSESLQRFLETDRQTDFEFARAPLMRLTLLRIGRESYYFIWSSHHILFDGWCKQLIIQEVFTLYEGYSQGRENKLERPCPYQDFITWLKHLDMGRAETFWREELKGFTSPTPLVWERPRRPQSERQNDEQHVRFNREITSRLDDTARRLQITVNTILQGVWALILSRHSGEHDVLFGITVSGRSAPLRGIERMIGLFINALPMRVHACGEETLRTYLKSLQAKQMSLLEYEHSPLIQVQSWSDISSETPLFESLFLFQNYPVDGAIRERTTAKLQISEVRNFEKVNYPMMVLASSGTELLLRLVYDNLRFDATAVMRLSSCLRSVVEAMAGDPERRIGSIELWSASERQQILLEWNDTVRDYNRPLCLHELFERIAHRTPDAIALVYEEEELSYAELNRRANQVAHYLRKHEAGPEARVGILLGRSLNMVVAIVGILKAGGAYAPLDPNYPLERLHYMVDDSGAQVLLTEERHNGIALSPLTRRICLDKDWETIAQESVLNPARINSPANTAYVIYTSGSTGKPKGVEISHESAVAFLNWAHELYPENRPENILASTSICFDLSIYELFLSLCFGGRIILVESLLSLTTSATKEEVGLINSVPSVIQGLINSGGMPQSLRTVNLAGEALSIDLVIKLYEDCSVNEVFNLYGPTESTTYSTFTRVPRDSDAPISIGRPIANTRVYILDSEFRAVPNGAVGELYISGTGLARGYLNRPDVTAERFIPDPFGQEPGSRLYRTGDLTRYRADANIEYLGRIDHQVKIRGFRIELGEIESALLRRVDVAQCVVCMREDKPGEKRLTAYVTPSEEGRSLSADLRGYLIEKLPDYMVPSIFVEIAQLPLTPNGKIDRKSLPPPETPNIVGEGEEPRTGVERTIARIWAKALGLDSVGIHQNFFELGGDSILCMQIVSKAQQAGISITPRQIFLNPTVAKLAKAADASIRLRAPQGIVSGPAPLTPAQHWFFGQNLKSPHHFNQSLILETRGRVDLEKIETIVRALLIHHDVLRTRFPQEAGRRLQVVAKEVEGETFRHIDLSGLEGRQKEQALGRIVPELQDGPDLQTGPLFRVVYFEMGQESAGRLLMIAHHLVIDAVSWRILVEDMERLYEQLAQGDQMRLPEKTTSYQQWAEALLEYCRKGYAQEEIGHWLTMARRQVSALPRDYPEADAIVGSATGILAELNELETERLVRESPKYYGAELQEILVAALVQSMTQWSGNQTLLIEFERHGREEEIAGADLVRTVGWFTTIYPVWFQRAENKAPRRQLDMVRERMRAVPKHGLGYGILRYLDSGSSTAQELARAQKAEICFNYLGRLDHALSGDGLFSAIGAAQGDRSSEDQRRWTFEINCWISQARFQVKWAYSRKLYRSETVKRLVKDYLDTVRYYIAQTDPPGCDEQAASILGVDDLELDNILAEIRVRPGETL